MLRFRRVSQAGLAALTGFALAALSCAGPAHAQAPARLPVVPPQGSPLPGVVTPEAPRLAPGLARPPPPSAPAETSTGAMHPIATVVVDGVTAFSPATVSALTGRLTGPAVPEGQIEASRRALVELYRSQGYVYTTVRAIIRGTELRFQVVEGYVAAVKLDGDIGPAGVQVLRFLNHLVGEIPLKTRSEEHTSELQSPA